MKELRFALSFLALILAASFALSCGASQGPGQLQSIALSPAAAAAQQQFTATGFYVHPNHTVIPQPASWGACQQNVPTTEVSVTQGGMAQCASGATGTYDVFAFVTVNQVCTLPQNQCGGGCNVVGTAQLTCP
jgi:hypothetical protein